MSTTATTNPTENTPVAGTEPIAAPIPNQPGPSVHTEGPTPFHSASLYVGDLAPDANEALLFEIFNAVGPVASIRVCRDAVTRRSLGYAYVNYHQLSDAERALDTMNFSMIKSKPCRIMWSQRDPSLRRSGVGNIFVKNLHESIDNKQLYDTFSLFGNILSCKVVTDRENACSKGYGYVHYETAEAANAAIEKLDGMLIDGQEVQVGHFIGRNQRPGQDDFTNCYIKNIPLDWDDERLKKEFSQFGEIASAAITKGIRRKSWYTKKEVEDGIEKKEGATENEDAKDNEEKKEIPETEEESTEKKIESLGFGFVNFVEHECAAAAVESLNGKLYTHNVEGEEVERELYVGRAQKKSERDREMRVKYEAEKMDRISKFQGVNLYVKNLDDSVTDDVLRDEFSAMGTITSARVMKDMEKEGRSRGFGFVCFSSPEEATRAVNEMNGKLIANKPIFVALAQRREVRRAQLEAQHANRAAGPGGPGPGQHGMMRGPMGGPMGYPGVPMYMQRGGPGGGMQPAYPMALPQMMGPGGRGGQRPGAYPMMGQPGGRGYVPYGGVIQGRGRGAPMTQGGRGGPQSGRGGRNNPAQGRGLGNNQQIKFNQQARNAGSVPPGQAQQQSSQVPQPMPAPEGALTASALASASPEMQKNMIGERLYPLIHHSQPELAGKITGMLLEMDNSELLHLLESPEALRAKIDEAIQVLEAHQSTE